ncbi:hypothetical protein ACN6A1_09010 [Myxococcus virescens]|uniref:hypothetical protein n=1 Tax=Myxococcus virescens TaxID=83456 RepID=UPI003DA56BED
MVAPGAAAPRNREKRAGWGLYLLSFGASLLGALAAAVIFWVAWTAAFFMGQALGVVSDAALASGLLVVGALAGTCGGVVAAVVTALCMKWVSGRGSAVAWLMLAGWVVLGAVGSRLTGGGVGPLCGGLVGFTLLVTAGAYIHDARKDLARA